MPLETKLYNALSGSTSFTAYPIFTGGALRLPATVYNVVSKRTIRGFSPMNGMVLENARVQFDMYATALDSQRASTEELLTLLDAATGFTAVHQESPEDDYDDETGVYRRMMDVSIWNQEPHVT